MATSIPASQLTLRVEHLLEQKQQHTDAIAHIDGMLAAVGAALNGSAAPAPRAAAPAKAAKAAKAAPAAGKGRRRGRGHFALSAEESILAFVKENKNPTTRDVNQHFKAEGRSSTADNALTKLVKDKRLKRIPLGKGIRGSHYSLA